MSTAQSTFEEIHVSGNKLLTTIKGLVRAGNVRRVVIRNPDGRTVLDLPLNAGLVGAALLPFWAAIGGVAALAARFTIVVERTDTALTRSDAAPPM